MPGEGGVCGAVVDAVLVAVAVLAGVALAGGVEAAVTGLLGMLAGLADVGAAVVFDEVEVAGFAVIVAGLPVEVEVDLPAVAEDELPVVAFVDLEDFDLDVLLVELVEEVEPLAVLWASSTAEPTVPMNRAPKTSDTISFLI